MRIWSPARTNARTPLPLLLAHDGPEYERRAQLTRYSAALIAAGTLPAHRVALLSPSERDEWYSASRRYARALAHEIAPAIDHAVTTDGGPVGIGASLGAVALLHAHTRAPRTFAGLFLQSGSFFVPRYDRHERRFARYPRIVRFVREPKAHPIPVVLTCGANEENVHNNRVMADALARHGYDAGLHEVPGMHDFTAWRDALDPHLTRLLQRLW